MVVVGLFDRLRLRIAERCGSGCLCLAADPPALILSPRCLPFCGGGSLGSWQKPSRSQQERRRGTSDARRATSPVHVSDERCFGRCGVFFSISMAALYELSGLQVMVNPGKTAQPCAPFPTSARILCCMLHLIVGHRGVGKTAFLSRVADTYAAAQRRSRCAISMRRSRAQAVSRSARCSPAR